MDRVGRQPIRKLGKNERLIKPLLGTLEYNVPNDNLIIGIASALKFESDSDEESIKLNSLIKEKGMKEALKEVTENSINDEIISKVEKVYNSL